MSQNSKLSMDVDLARVRALRVDLDLDRGSRELEATLAVIGATAPVAGAALAAKPVTLFAKGAVTKALGALLVVGAASGVTLAISTERPTDAGDPVEARGAADAARTREAEVTPTAPVVAHAAQEPSDVPSAPAEAPPSPVSPKLMRGPAAPVPAGSGSRLADELRDVASARDLLTTSPEAALLRADATTGGQLDQERDIIAIRALLALGRNPEAKARAERFLARYPESPFRATAEQVVANTALGDAPSERSADR